MLRSFDPFDKENKRQKIYGKTAERVALRFAQIVEQILIRIFRIIVLRLTIANFEGRRRLEKKKQRYNKNYYNKIYMLCFYSLKLLIPIFHF